MKVVILAGGLGSRLEEITKVIPQFTKCDLAKHFLIILIYP